MKKWSFCDFALYIKGVSETNKNKVKEEKGGFLGMSLDTLSACLLVYVSFCLQYLFLQAKDKHVKFFDTTSSFN